MLSDNKKHVRISIQATYLRSSYTYVLSPSNHSDVSQKTYLNKWPFSCPKWEPVPCGFQTDSPTHRFRRPYERSFATFPRNKPSGGDLVKSTIADSEKNSLIDFGFLWGQGWIAEIGRVLLIMPVFSSSLARHSASRWTVSRNDVRKKAADSSALSSSKIWHTSSTWCSPFPPPRFTERDAKMFHIGGHFVGNGLRMGFVSLNWWFRSGMPFGMLRTWERTE